MRSGRIGVIVAVVLGCGLPGLARGAQQPDLTKPTVDIVAAVGCAQKQSGTAPVWTLTRASEPTVSRDPYASEKALEEAKTVALGSKTFTLVGVAEFVSEEERKQLPSNSVAAFAKLSTGELQHGHKVAVRGLLIQVGNQPRINLTSVVSLADSCR